MADRGQIFKENVWDNRGLMETNDQMMPGMGRGGLRVHKYIS